jgi:hypothetical protein
MSRTPWVVTDFEKGNTGECQRCGEVLRINLPQPTEVWLAAVKAFCKLHEKCEEAKP